MNGGGQQVRALSWELEVESTDRNSRSVRSHASSHLGDELPSFRLGLPIRSDGRGRMDNGADGGAVHKGKAVRGTTSSAFALHRIPQRAKREAACREAAFTADKRPVRETDGVGDK